MNILQDLKERFLNFETVKGIYLLPAGGVICYITLFYLQYVIQAFCLALGIYMMVEGFRKIQVNRAVMLRCDQICFTIHEQFSR
jgi:hypothetical protein